MKEKRNLRYTAETLNQTELNEVNERT